MQKGRYYAPHQLVLALMAAVMLLTTVAPLASAAPSSGSVYPALPSAPVPQPQNSGSPSVAQTIQCDVTRTDDANECGTLRFAVGQLAGNTPQTPKVINFNFGQNPAYIKLNSGITLPPGVSLNGQCNPAPTIVLDGSNITGTGLTLSGSNIITGVKIIGFNGNKLKTAGTGNKLVCVRTTNETRATVPPNPETVAPPLNPTLPTSLYSATLFIYTGANPIQTGVQPGTIKPDKVAVLRGRVLDRNNQPLPGVTIKVKDHAEFGQTLSRADGWFDLVVNGGGTLTVDYLPEGFLPAQRSQNVPWQEYVTFPEVVLIALDGQVTNIAPNSPQMQVARGNAVTDSDGTRQATLLVPANTTAVMKMRDGTTQPLNTLKVRATEYTVGANGPQTMPADLPPTSGYTYALEYSVDEALSAGAASVEFSQPIFHYVDNFLNFPAGGIVPMGYYDRIKAQWVPSQNGRVIQIVGVTDGLAEVDINGDGTADNAATLAGLGFTDAERQQLAQLYTTGKSLWRVPITHFTPWDCNWPYGPPNGATDPNQPRPDSISDSQKDDCKKGSIIGCQNQTLGEILPVVGSNMTLRYHSDRVPGYKAGQSIKIPLTGATLPPGLKRVELQITVAGQLIKQSFTPAPNLSHIFNWNNKDVYGRAIVGEQDVFIRVGYTYQAVYSAPANFEESFGNFSGVPISGDRQRTEITLWQETNATVSYYDMQKLGVGGWQPDVHHLYNPINNTITYGYGGRSNNSGQTDFSGFGVITYAAGLPLSNFGGYNGDGIPANQARLNGPQDMKVGPDGNVYIADTFNNRIRMIRPDGIITTVVGNGSQTFGGDGGPATSASLNRPHGIAFGPDGSLYIADSFNHRIRKVSASGTITTIAGIGQSGLTGDDGPALAARLSTPEEIAVGKDGTIYTGDAFNRIRKITTEGLITTIAGKGTDENTDGIPATQVEIGLLHGLAIGNDDILYYSDHQRVRLIDAGNVVRTVAGCASCNNRQAGSSALDYRFNATSSVLVGPDGNVYIGAVVAPNNYPVQVVNPAGIIYPVLWRNYNLPNDPPGGLFVTRAKGLAFTADGTLYILDDFDHSLMRVPGVVNNNLLTAEKTVPSPDGNELYVFNGAGQHLRTLNALTKVVTHQFEYDAKGQINRISDSFGNATIFERDGSGKLTAVIGDGGQRSSVTLNADGYLESLTNPANERHDMTYQAGGLLKTFAQPRRDGPKNGVHTFTYDAEGRLIKDENAAGGWQALRRTTLNNGYQVEIGTSEGLTTTYRYEFTSDKRAISTQTEPGGQKFVREVRPNNTTIITDSTGTVITATYTADPNWGIQVAVPDTIARRSPDGKVETFTNKRTVVLTDPNDKTSLKVMTDTMTVNGLVTTYAYDATNRKITLTEPGGRQSVATFNAQGQPTEIQPGAGVAAFSFGYDARGRLTSAGQLSQTTTYGYDTKNRLTSRTDPTGQVTTYGYDNADRIITTTRGTLGAIGFGYDANGNTTGLKMPGDLLHKLEFDAQNRLRGYTPPGMDATPYTFGYNSENLSTGTTLPGGRTITYNREAGKRRISNIVYPEATIAFSYKPGDESERVMTATHTPASGTPQQIGFTYNGNTVTSVSWNGPATGIYTYTFDAKLNLTGVMLSSGATNVTLPYTRSATTGLVTGYGPFSIGRAGPGGRMSGMSDSALNMTVGYDALARFQNRTHRIGGGAALYDLGVVYNKAGQIETRTQIVNGVTRVYQYTYTAAGYLEEVKRDGVSIEFYEYDGRGNRTSKKLGNNPAQAATYDGQDRLQTLGGTAYGFNADGFLATRGADAFQYSAKGELIAATVGGQNITYAYDALHRRVARTDSAGTFQYLYGNPDDAFQVTAVRHPGGQLDVLFYDDAGLLTGFERNGTRYYVATDQVGTPWLVFDNAGTVVKSLEWDSWGNLNSDSNPALVLPLGFAGGIADSLSGLVRFGYRDYDPATGRWTARDPLLFGGGQINLYAYVNSNPVLYRDPTGLFCVGGSLYEGIGGGAQVCLTKEGFSVCGELGFGLGGSVDVEPWGKLADNGVSGIAEVEVGVGPINGSLGVEVKTDCHGDLTAEFKPEGGIIAGAYKAMLDKDGNAKLKGPLGSSDLEAILKSGKAKFKVGASAKAAVKVCGQGRW
jgi:RHS repeat-associated protein